MGKHITDGLHATCHVMSSDEDLEIVADIYVGFNTRHELTISIDYFDYEYPELNHSTALVVSTPDAFKMAKRHKEKFSDLPWFISQCMWEWREIINPTVNQTKECFREITDNLIEEGCRFRVIHTYGKGNFSFV